MVEEIIGRLPELTEAQLGRLGDEIRRERRRRASLAGGGQDAPHVQEGAAPPVTEVLEYRPYEDGYLQLELRRYVRRDGSARERGRYWHFQDTLLALLALPHIQKSRRTLGVRECEVDIGGDSASLMPRACATSPFVACSTAASKGAQIYAGLQDVVSSCAALALIFVSAFAVRSSTSPA